MDFEDRLEKAIARGEKNREAQDREAAGRALTEEESKRLHAQIRLELAEHIEKCLLKLPDHFPGFQLESIVGERGWGAACFRDDVGLGVGVRKNLYSRIEITVRPYSPAHVVEITAKGTVRNKEVFNRMQFRKLSEADAQPLREAIDLWTLEYAEKYAAAK
ncbi:MAG: hypothetical protein K8U03_21395 [Planctomycetia bacterium]|nr:hypothetical protein [Planctomycetia bacterium]